MDSGHCDAIFVNRVFYSHKVVGGDRVGQVGGLAVGQAVAGRGRDSFHLLQELWGLDDAGGKSFFPPCI